MIMWCAVGDVLIDLDRRIQAGVGTTLPNPGEVRAKPPRPNRFRTHLRPRKSELNGKDRWWVDHEKALEKRRAAIAFLHEHLANGMVTCMDVMAAAKARGITCITLRTAKRDAGVASVRPWCWCLPEHTMGRKTKKDHLLKRRNHE
jgi:hypothetical protein